MNSDTAGWLAQRLVDRLPAEPRSGLRSWQLLVLGHLYLSRHRKEVEWVFDPILRALQADADPDVRSNAAVVLGDFARHELDRTVQALKSCLETEKDPGVRAAIERRLSQIQD